MRPKSVVLIVIAMGCGLIASIGISQVIERRGQSSTGSIETSEIFVTLVDIPIGEPLTAQMIKLEAWPMDKLPEGAITTLDDIEGRRPKQPLFAGEPVLYRKLIDQNGLGGASEKIPKGYRVMSVRVTMDSAASGLILPGDRVDVLVYLREGKGVPAPITRTILTDATVFAVNEHINREVEDDGGAIQAKTVSLLLKPDQVERLMLATELGKLRLSLRRADDATETVSNGASLEDLHLTASAQDGGGEEPTIPVTQDPSQDSLLGLLNSMKNQDIPAQTTTFGSIMHTMEIHTPEGISRYTWDDPSKLPRELASGDTGLAGLVVEPLGVGDSFDSKDKSKDDKIGDASNDDEDVSDDGTGPTE